MKTQMFNIALPQKLVQEADRIAKKEYRNRSELIREALRLYLQEIQEWKELFAYGRKQGKIAGIASEEDVNRLVAGFRHGKVR